MGGVGCVAVWAGGRCCLGADGFGSVGSRLPSWVFVVDGGERLEGFALFGCEGAGDDDAGGHEEIPLALFGWHAAASDTKGLAASGARGDLDLDPVAFERGHLDGGTESGLGKEDWHGGSKVDSIAGEAFVVLNLHPDIEVTAGAAGTLPTFAADADDLAGLDPFGYTNGDGLRVRDSPGALAHLARRVDHGPFAIAPATGSAEPKQALILLGSAFAVAHVAGAGMGADRRAVAAAVRALLAGWDGDRGGDAAHGVEQRNVDFGLEVGAFAPGSGTTSAAAGLPARRHNQPSKNNPTIPVPLPKTESNKDIS